MIDINLIREKSDLVKENIKKKFQDEKLELVDEVKELDEKARSIQKEVDDLKANKNKLSKEIGNLMREGKREEADKIKNVNVDSYGDVRIADDVVGNIAAIASTEIEGVAGTVGNVTKELMSRMGLRTQSKGVKVVIDGNMVTLDMALIMKYGYNIDYSISCLQVCRRGGRICIFCYNYTDLVCNGQTMRQTQIKQIIYAAATRMFSERNL